MKCPGAGLKELLDHLEEVGFFVMAPQTCELLYFNQRIKDVTPEVAVGMDCRAAWPDRCDEYLLREVEERESARLTQFDEACGEYMNFFISKVPWEGSVAYAVFLVPNLVRVEEDEQQWLGQIKDIYSQSLGILLNGCMIINLSQDYFVTCQVGGMGLEISDRQPFKDTSRNYFQQLIHPDEQEEFFSYFSKQALDAIFGEGKERISKKFRCMTELGTYRMMEFFANRVEQYQVEDSWCVLVSKDVHEEFLREQHSNMAIQQLLMAVKTIYQSMISLNLTQGTYEVLQNDTKGILDIPHKGSSEEMLEYHLLGLAPEFRAEYKEKFSREALMAAFARGEMRVYMEVRQKDADGLYFWSSTQIVWVRRSHTEDILAIAMCKNIEEERRQQEENLKKEREARDLVNEALQKAKDSSLAKSEFLSKMSHDIRTPLNAVIGMTALAQANLENPEKLSGYLEKIKLSGEHLLGLINEVLDMSKIENGDISLTDEVFDLEKAVRDVVLMVQQKVQEKEQKLEVTLDPGMHTLVSGDQQRLRQVLLNVLENASKYTQNQGHVRFTVSENTKDNSIIGSYLFVIQDDGIGMKKEFLEHIYEPFARADDTRINKIPGTGLGMAIVKNIVTMMGGDISVESEYGNGSCFTITLCLEKKQVSEKEIFREEEKKHGDFTKMRILVAEDNELNQEIMEEMIRLAGPLPEIVDNGEDAVKAVQDHDPHYYDLVFMDIRMPGIDGYEAARRIRNLEVRDVKTLLVIALTADAFKDDAKKAKMAGMNGHVSKPITMKKLMDILEYCSIWGKKQDQAIPFYGEHE
ncbi:MAG: response regulator [Clostridium sp.]|jgi:signal transduction histidine kinase/CheY-like chemotaxis protein|nr:response regulator [Clostridium sp.]